MSRLLYSFVALAFLFSVTSLQAIAQESKPLLIETETRIGGGDFSCFDYYKSDSVQVIVSPSGSDVSAGSEIGFNGQLVNDNDYPLVDVTLYARVFRKDEMSFAAVSSNPVVDQFLIKENLTLAGKSSVPISHEWLVPTNAKGGEYYIAYFVVANNRYNLLGETYTDGMVGSIASFTVNAEDGKLPPAELNKVGTTLNNNNYEFGTKLVNINKAETVVVTTSITNPTNETKILPLQWNQYAWDSVNPDNRRNTKTEIITLAPNESKSVSYEVKPQRESIVYVTAVTQDKDAKSIVSVRYAQTGIKETRVGLLSINDFPLQEGKETTIFACAQSTNVPIVEGNILTLELSDEYGNVIHTYRHEGQIWNTLAGFGESFVPNNTYSNITLTAKLERDGTLIEESSIVYDCQTIDLSKCNNEINNMLPVSNSWQQVVLVMVGAGSLLVVFIVLVVFFRKKGVTSDSQIKDIPTTIMSLFLLLMVGAIIFSPHVTEAQSCSPIGSEYVWNGSFWAPNGSVSSWNWDILAVGGDTSAPPMVWVDQTWPYDMNVDLHIVAGSGIGSSYQCGMTFGLPSGGISGTGCSIPAGASNCNGSLTWNTSNTLSPNVHNLTTDTNFSNSANGSSVTTVLLNGANTFAVREGSSELGTVTLTGTCASGSSWNGTSCAAVTATATVSGSGCMIPTGASTCNGLVTWTSTNATAPTLRNVTTDTLISSNANGTDVPIGLTHGYNYVIVRDGSNILNSADIPAMCTGSDTWNGTSCVATGACSPDGHTQSFLAPICCSGTYSTSNTSSCTVYSNSQMPWGGSICLNFPEYTCTPSVAPTANLTINGSDGPISVNNGESLSISWNSSNAASCTAFGAGWGSATGVSLNGSASISATVSDTYIINCDGVIDSVVVNVNIGSAPSAPTITGPNTSGTGVSNLFIINSTDADGDSIYYEIDWNNDGAADTYTPGVGYVPSGTNINATQSWTSGGSYTFGVRATDNTGLSSQWSTHTVTVNEGAVVSTNTLPNFTIPTGVFDPSTNVDLVTGNYNSAEVRFQTGNNGGSDTVNTVNYTVEIDYGNDGSFDVSKTGTIGNLTSTLPGSNFNGSENFSSVPFGNYRIKITVDSNNDVVEVNEADNVWESSGTLLPTAPNLIVTVNPKIVRENQTATISWDTEVSYPLNCKISGPALTAYSFNPNVNGTIGNRTTGALSSKSEYLLSCTEPITNTTFTESASVEIIPNAEEI